MLKILLAIYDDVAREVYRRVFEDEDFEVIATKDGNEALELTLKEKPNLILADVSLLGMSGLSLLKLLQENPKTKKIPVLIFASLERESERIKAMELGARDFIVSSLTLPRDVIAKVKIHLGFQKTYEISIDPKSQNIISDLRKDMGYSPEIICPYCKIQMNLFLMRDLSRGKDYFKVSFTCPICEYTE